MVEVLMWRDDINGKLGAEPKRLAVGGCAIDIDLTPENWAALLNLLAPFIQAGRITSKPGAVPSEIRAILNGSAPAPAIEGPTPLSEEEVDELVTRAEVRDAEERIAEREQVATSVEYSVVRDEPKPKPPAKKPRRKGGRGYPNDEHSPQERREIAEWIRLHRIPNVAARGRKPADVWEAFLAKDLTKLADKHQPPALQAAIRRAG